MHRAFRNFCVTSIICASLTVFSGCSANSGSQPGNTGTTPGGTPTGATLVVSGPSTIALGTPAQYTATISGGTSAAAESFEWAVNGTPGGNATIGTISSSGLYTPPSAVPTNNSLIIQAKTTGSPSLTGSLKATLLQSLPVITTAVASTQDGGKTYLVDVQGTGFVSGATLLIGGQSVPTNAVEQSDLQTTVSDPAGQTMQISVQVQNPNPGGAQSASVNVTLSQPVATATAAARFLDQTSFGPTADTIAHVEQIGLQAALTEQFGIPPTQFSLPPQNDSECAESVDICTRSEFVNVQAYGQDQLRQRVAMALSEMWVASVQNKGAMPYYLNTLASDAFTNYRQIMEDVTLSPAMGAYLNMLNSPAAHPGAIANENYGREIMQLFTIGLNVLNPDGTMQTDSNGNPIPTYSEDQVQSLARAFTGWTFANADGSAPTAFNTTQNWNAPMVAVEAEHDTTAKPILNGVTLPAGQTAEQDLKGALDNIFAHPNVGPFVCRQLIQHLVSGNPSPAYVQRVASVFNDNGSGVRGDMKAVLTAIFMDQEARAGDAQTGDQADNTPAVDGGHLREPLLWTMNLIRGLNATQVDPSDPYPFTALMQSKMTVVGESPVAQESVFNYFTPGYLIPISGINSPEFQLENVGTVALRPNLADTILANQVAGLNVDLSATSILGQQAANPANLIDYLGMVFMHSQMPTDMRNSLITVISSIPASEPETRAQVAAYLVLTSSEYKVIH